MQSNRLVLQVGTFPGRRSFIWRDELSNKYLGRSERKQRFSVSVLVVKPKTKLSTTATLNRRN